MTLTGGTVTLSDYSDNSIVSDAGTLNNYDMIPGAGTIGDANLTLNNYATIDANDSIPLILDTGPAIINEAATGILEASSGSTLEIESNVTNNGQVLVKDGGTVELINDTITGGQINVSSTGDATKLEISGTVTLTGGTVTLSDSSDNYNRQRSGAR